MKHFYDTAKALTSHDIEISVLVLVVWMLALVVGHIQALGVLPDLLILFGKTNVRVGMLGLDMSAEIRYLDVSTRFAIGARGVFPIRDSSGRRWVLRGLYRPII